MTNHATHFSSDIPPCLGTPQCQGTAPDEHVPACPSFVTRRHCPICRDVIVTDFAGWAAHVDAHSGPEGWSR